MTNSKTETAVWWIFYPLKGLDIADEYHDLDAPMFRDVTLISRAHIRQIFPLLKFDERNEADATSMMEHLALGEDFHSLIAVKRRGPRLLIDQTSGEDKSGDLARCAKKRASQVAALLALTILAESTDWRTCALIDQIHRQYQTVAMLALDVGAVSYRFTPSQARTISESIVIGRHELRARFETPQIAPLATILTAQRSSIGDSLARAVVQSSIRLSDAIHNPNAAGQLLGAVTSIEILLTNQGDSFEITQRRIRTLIGPDAFQFFKADQVLNERHLYVHQGVAPSAGQLPLRATGLALACILCYAAAAPKFPAKKSFLTYLDFVHAGKRMFEDWTAGEFTCFERLIKHTVIQPHFPYFTKHSSDEHKQ